MLKRPTLILNRNWQPVNVACVARALVLVCRGTARVVDPQDYQLCGLSGADRKLVEVPLRSVLEREAGGLNGERAPCPRPARGPGAELPTWPNSEAPVL